MPGGVRPGSRALQGVGGPAAVTPMKRVLTALVLIPVVLALVWWAPRWLFFLGLLLFAFLTLWEYLELAGRMSVPPPHWPVYLVSLGVWVVVAYEPGQLLAAVIAGSLILFLLAVNSQVILAEILPVSAASVFGILYVVVPFALLLDLRARPGGARLVLYLLLLVWVGDTAAYYVGRAVGRHKLAPTVSPGKTVEGTAAGLVATVAVGFWLFRSWFGVFAPLHALLLPIAVNAAGQFGDLAESALKRGAGVKDSSSLLPGHGGLLDRLDSLLFATPALWYYWILLTRGGS